MYFATVAWLTSMPSLSNSPWIRGAPQSGLAVLICRIRSRISRSTDGRPDLERQRQNKRNRCRCHWITVAGLTKTITSRQRGHDRRATPRAGGRSRTAGVDPAADTKNVQLMAQGEVLEFKKPPGYEIDGQEQKR